MITANGLIESHRRGEKFSGIKLHNADFTGLNLHSIVLRNCDLGFSVFAGADLTNADFSSSNLAGCNFSGAILRNAKFQNANLSRANVSKALIEGTDFRNANFMFAHLCGNDLMKADLSGAALDWSCLIDTKLTEQQFSAVPQHAVLSLSPEEHGYKLRIASYEIKKLSGYSPLPQSAYASQGGKEMEYKSGSFETKEIHPVFRRKKTEHREM